MRVLSLFAGIGGFDLGFELAGFQTVAQVENDDYCNKILEHHFPQAKRYGDIREVTGEQITRDCGAIDIICGGFPCQDISSAGKGAGLEGERSGLWWEMHRLINELRPTWVVIENVAALRARGLDRVVAALEEMGRQVWCFGIPAAAVGAPHERKRIAILAYLPSERRGARRSKSKRQLGKTGAAGSGSSVAGTDSITRATSAVEAGSAMVAAAAKRSQSGSCCELADANNDGCGREDLSEELREDLHGTTGSSGERMEGRGGDQSSSELANSDSHGIRQQPGRCRRQDWEYSPFAFPARPGQRQFDWEAPRTIESYLGVTADGLPRKLALSACGNAFVPAIPYVIARTIQRLDRALAQKSF